MKKEGAGAVVVQGSLASKSTADLALKRGLPAALGLDVPPSVLARADEVIE